MNRFIKLMVFVMVLCASVLLFGGKADAQAVTEGSHSATPTAGRATCTTGEPVDFAVAIQDVNLNVTSGIVDYDVVIAWRSCNNPNDTRAYAVYGNREICPLAGWYGAVNPINSPNGEAYDCVKYIGLPPSYQGQSGLSCFGNTQTNQNCVTSVFAGARVADNGPITNPPFPRIIPMTYQIPNWSTANNLSGSHNIGGQMCQYYKPGPSYLTAVDNSRCLNINITARWNVTLANSGQCSHSIAGGDIFNPGQTKRVDYTVRNTGQQAWNANPGSAQRYRLRDQNASAPWSNPPHSPGAPREINIAGTGIQGGYVGLVLPGPGQTSWRQDLTVPASVPPGTYQFNWRIYGDIVGSGMGYLGPSCAMQVIVEKPTDKPYFKIYNGDAVVGSTFQPSDGSPCAPNSITPVPGIRAYSRSSGGYAGASAQFAAHALGTIDGFYSASQRSGQPNANSPLGLTFGNFNSVAGALVNQGQGGNDSSGAASRCMPNYFERFSDEYPSAVAPVGDQTLSPALFSAENIVVIDGNLTITGNISGDSTWNNINDMRPNYIVVKGDIYIRPGVTEIDGVFIAQSRDDGSGGVIDTCYVPSGSRQPCIDNNLTINGAFIAKKVELNRLGGDLRGATPGEAINGNIAEVFNFTPEVYFRFFDTEDTATGADGGYDSIVGLPPVL